MIDEVEVTRAIIESYLEKLKEATDLDVAICGGGPAGMVAAAYLSRRGMRVALFEKKLSLGGGMWAGGMFFNRMVLQPAAEELLREFGIGYEKRGKLLVASAVEGVARLITGAVEAGCRVFNGISVVDVMVKEGKVCGLVINWSAVDALRKCGLNLEVDPLVVRAEWNLDATGHGHEVCRVAQEKGLRLATPSGKPEGEGPLWAEKAEELVVENSRQVCPGLFVCGMAANAVFGAPRMGPIFGGMLLSGRRAAEMIIQRADKRAKKKREGQGPGKH